MAERRSDGAARDSLLDQYVGALRRSLGVTVHENVLQGRGRRAWPTTPDDEVFARAYEAGDATVAVTTLVADLETPVSAYLKLARGRAGNMFLLESVEGGAQRGRYSMIGLDPDLVFRTTGERAEINRRALHDPDAFLPCPGGATRGASVAARRIADRLAAGASADVRRGVRLSGYDMVRRMERPAPAKPDPIGVPEALLIRPTVMVVFDAARDEMAIVAPVRPARAFPRRPRTRARLCGSMRWSRRSRRRSTTPQAARPIRC